MKSYYTTLFEATALVALSMAISANAKDSTTPMPGVSVSEIVVTANKREQNIQNVGISIQTASGDTLIKLGINDPNDLQKIAPGFRANHTIFGTSVFTIRGVGFQDQSLAGSPTVSVYLDEAPLPFTSLTRGAILDLQRVEILKGPQGTLFGNNATGGAINYIANKPTDLYQAGGDFSYGRFSSVNATGFISGPITHTLDARLAVSSQTSGAWQTGYGPQSGQSIGGTDLLNGRLALLWKPSHRFKALLTVNGWRDTSFNQMGQLFGIAKLSPTNALSPTIANYPLAPHNDQAAGWNSCVNISPSDPIVGQQYGALLTAPNGVQLSEGPGSVAQAGGQPSNCIPARNKNIYFSAALRMDYELSPDLMVTSISEFQRFDRRSGIDGTGIPVQDFQSVQFGKVKSVYQELRLAGNIWKKGHWIIGANYEHEKTHDAFLQSFIGGTTAPSNIPFAALCAPFGAPTSTCTSAESSKLYTGASTPAVANPGYNASQYPAFIVDAIGPTFPTNNQQTTDYAIYASGEYPILDNLTLLGGVRYTNSDKHGQGCALDGGNGDRAKLGKDFSNLVEALSHTITFDQYLNGGGFGINPGSGGCSTTGPGPLYLTYGQNFPQGILKQSNVAWKAGINWKVTPDNLLYASVSQGYKEGSFPTIALTAYTQLAPVFQEGLLSYEAGFKSTLFDHQLTVNGAGFYYDYTNKQILGSIIDPVFGPVQALVNIPKSHVVGFELSGVWAPAFLPGLAISPGVSHQSSRVDGCAAVQSRACIGGDFFAYDAFGGRPDVTGQPFPMAPAWQATLDAEYDWKPRDDIGAFFGINLSYESDTHALFANSNPDPVKEATYNSLSIPGYTLIDLRAGVSHGPWRFELWGHNVTNKWYFIGAAHLVDTLVHYTGMPATYGLTLSYRFQ